MVPPGVELLVAARADAVVPALVVGLGGIWAEALDDVAIVPLPASAERVAGRSRSLRGAAVLSGGRGREPVDLASVAELAASVGALLLERELRAARAEPGRGPSAWLRGARRGGRRRRVDATVADSLALTL